MPLAQGPDSVGTNIKKLMGEHTPHEQAVAIVMELRRRASGAVKKKLLPYVPKRERKTIGKRHYV